VPAGTLSVLNLKKLDSSVLLNYFGIRFQYFTGIRNDFEGNLIYFEVFLLSSTVAVGAESEYFSEIFSKIFSKFLARSNELMQLDT
jgi:hypothetical protein